MRVIELVHFPVSPADFPTRKDRSRPFPRTLFHLSGDSHINKIRRHRDHLEIQTTSYSYRKRDSAPVGSRIIELKNGAVRTHFRPAGFKQLLAAAIPSEGGLYRPGELPVQVNAYAGTATPAKVDVVLSAGAPPGEMPTKSG